MIENIDEHVAFLVVHDDRITVNEHRDRLVFTLFLESSCLFLLLLVLNVFLIKRSVIGISAVFNGCCFNGILIVLDLFLRLAFAYRALSRAFGFFIRDVRQVQFLHRPDNGEIVVAFCIHVGLLVVDVYVHLRLQDHVHKLYDLSDRIVTEHVDVIAVLDVVILGLERSVNLGKLRKLDFLVVNDDRYSAAVFKERTYCCGRSGTCR